MTANAYSIGQLIASMGLDTTRFQAGMASVNTSMAAADVATKKAAMSMSASMAAAGASMQATGKKMTRYMTLPIIGVGMVSTKVFADFEASMAKITGLVGVAKSQVEAWKSEVLALGPATGQGPEKLADALFFITSAGIRGAEAMEVLEMAAKASTGGLGEAKTVADLVTSAMNAYGKENLSAAQATDVLVAAVREGKAEATELAGAMGMVLPIASEYGVTFNQVGAAFAGMTRTGTNARVAATQLKAILAAMASPALNAEDAMEKYGTSSAKFRKIVEEEGLIQALTHLKTAVDGNKTAMAEIFPNIRALMGVLDLLGKNMEDNVAIFKALEDPTGALDAAFESATNTIRFKFQKAFATLKTHAIAYGSTLSGSLIPLIEKATALIAQSTEKWNKMSDSQKQNRIRVLALTAVMGPLLQVTGRLIKLMATPKGPYGIAIAGAIALTLAIRNLVIKSREQREVYDAVATAHEKVITQYETQVAKIAYLVAIIEDENISQKGRIAAINELKTIMPGYNADISKEGELIGHSKTAIEEYLVVLKEKIRLQVFEGEYVAIIQKQVQAQRDLDKAITDARVAQEAFVKAGSKKKMYIATPGQAKLQEQMTGEYAALINSNIAMAERETALHRIEIAQAALTEEMKRYNLTLPGATPAGGGDEGDGGGGGGRIITDEEAALKLAEKQLQARLDLARFIADEELELYVDAFQKRIAAEQLSYERSKAALEQQGADQLLTTEEVAAGIEALELAHQARMLTIANAGANAIAQGKARAVAEAVRNAEILYREEQEKLMEHFNTLTNVANQWQKSGQMLQEVFNGIGAAVALANNKFSQWLTYAGRILGATAQLVSVIKKIMIAKQAEAMGYAISEGAKMPFPINLLAIAASVASVVAAFAAIPKFAEGGLAYGPMIANIGEYPGARSDPEVVSPLSKLKTIIGDTGGGGGKVVFEIAGRKLVGVLQKENTLMNTY